MHEVFRYKKVAEGFFKRYKNLKLLQTKKMKSPETVVSGLKLIVEFSGFTPGDTRSVILKISAINRTEGEECYNTNGCVVIHVSTGPGTVNCIYMNKCYRVTNKLNSVKRTLCGNHT